MRTIEEIKKEQDQEMYNYGRFMAQAEISKLKVLTLGREAQLVLEKSPNIPAQDTEGPVKADG